MTILSPFIHPRIISNQYELLSSVEHERKYIWSILVTKQLVEAIDFHTCKQIHESQWLPATVCLPTFFRISAEERIEESKWWQYFHCGWTDLIWWCAQLHRISPDFPDALCELLFTLQEGRRLNDQRCSFRLEHRRRCYSEPSTPRHSQRGEETLSERISSA